MTTITAEQFGRTAIVYVRQSTAFQVSNNLESGRRQYGLVERARQLGWIDVQVIDDDLGRSGGGATRPGFEKLLTAICERRVGAVLSIEASRLARNGRDWHTLLEFCGLVGTLIVDEDGVYDPRSINDRLLLGMKGTMSEMEVSVFRQRSMEAMKQRLETIGSSWTRIDGSEKPSRSCSGSSLSFALSAKCWSGHGRRTCFCQPSFRGTVSGLSSGSCRSIIHCIIS
jgi:hypothetical protein